MNANQKTNALAKEIADEAAKSEIGSGCPVVSANSGEWWDTRRADKLAAKFIKRSIVYLERRGMLERHYDFEHYVRVKQAA